MSGSVKCTRRGGRTIVLGNGRNKPAIKGQGVPFKGKPSLEQYSEEKPPALVTLRCTQSRALRKAAKPTLPKLPWA